MVVSFKIEWLELKIMIQILFNYIAIVNKSFIYISFLLRLFWHLGLWHPGTRDSVLSNFLYLESELWICLIWFTILKLSLAMNRVLLPWTYPKVLELSYFLTICNIFLCMLNLYLVIHMPSIFYRNCLYTRPLLICLNLNIDIYIDHN